MVAAAAVGPALKSLATWVGPALSAAFLAPLVTGPILDYRRQEREQRLQEKALRNKALADAMLLADEGRTRRAALEAEETARLRQLAMMQQILAAEDRERSLDRLAGILASGPLAIAGSVGGPMVGTGGLTNADLMLLSQSAPIGNGLLSAFGYR